MRVGLLSQWFDPEPGPASLPGMLARGLARRGHEVRVLTGFPNYPTGRIMSGYRMSRRLDEFTDGIRIRRVALYPSHDASAFRRVATYGSFAASALASGVSALRGLDAVWVSNSPITVSLPMWFVRHVHRIPVVLHVLDLWPDTVSASGFLGDGRAHRVVGHCLGGWCQGMYRSATRVAYISPGVGELLTRRGVPPEKLLYIPMWADERPPADGGDLRAALGLRPDQIALGYAGSLGITQGLETLVDACALTSDPRFVCLVAGSGIAEAELRRRVGSAGVSNIRFLGRLPRERMPAFLAACDVHFVGLRDTAMAPYTMPSKVQTILAAGRALLIAGVGDAASVARDSGAGIVARPDDPQDVASAIHEVIRLGRGELHALGGRGRRYYLRRFSMESGVSRVEAALRAAATTGVRR